LTTLIDGDRPIAYQMWTAAVCTVTRIDGIARCSRHRTEVCVGLDTSRFAERHPRLLAKTTATLSSHRHVGPRA
jgi:hypothetical protein